MTEELLRRTKALADPTRLRLVQMLVGRECAVHELTDVLATGQSRISMHLGKLKAAGLVRERRLGREVLYTADPDVIEALERDLHAMFADAAAQGLPIRLAPGLSQAGRGTGRVPRSLLFLCTANSFRSQLAEAWARQLAGGSVVAQSAGLEPTRIKPLAIDLMREVGIEMSGQYAKPITPALLAQADVVVTVCGSELGWVPVLAPDVRSEVWALPDPTDDARTEAAAQAAGRLVRDDLRRRVEALLASLQPPA